MICKSMIKNFQEYAFKNDTNKQSQLHIFIQKDIENGERQCDQI